MNEMMAELGYYIHPWNGYNSCWVDGNCTRRQIIKEILSFFRKDKMVRGSRDSLHRTNDVIVIEDDDHFTIKLISAYEFYGERKEIRIMTTRRCEVAQLDQDDYILMEEQS